MPLLVTGSIAIDTVTTPYGVSEECLGGSAVYFCMAASFFAPVRLIGAIGADCPFHLPDIFKGRNVDLRGLEIRLNSKTFRWKGSYYKTMNDAITDKLELNVLEEDPPVIPQEFRDSKFVFLANTAPALQMQLLSQIHSPKFVAADTMNCWINNKREDLEKLLKKITALIINEDEARILAREPILTKAADIILAMGPDVVVIKKGESGSILKTKKGDSFILPAYPATEVKDPTGAGDSFAGALMGYIAQARNTDFETLKAAVAYGTVTASFTIADFSLGGLTSIKRADIDNRLKTLRKMTHF